MVGNETARKEIALAFPPGDLTCPESGELSNVSGVRSKLYNRIGERAISIGWLGKARRPGLARGARPEGTRPTLSLHLCIYFGTLLYGAKTHSCTILPDAWRPEPVREWLKELPADDRGIVGEDIKDVEFAWPLGLPLVRSLGRDLWEVRSSLTHGRIARVIFCVADSQMILLNGLIKKTQQTPLREIDLALKRMQGIER